MSAPDFTRTSRTTVRRLPQRGVYDRAAVFAILDEALVSHVGFVRDGQPFVIPTIFARVEDRLYLHGSAASRMLGALAEGADVCVTVTLVDGLVLARSAFHHSMNYRSVVVLGVAEEVTDPERKRRALEAIVEHVAPGRSAIARAPNDKELAATRVMAVTLDEVSAKIRTGPPIDDEEDLGYPCWAGIVPLRSVPGEPVAAAGLAPGLAAPDRASFVRGEHG